MALLALYKQLIMAKVMAVLEKSVTPNAAARQTLNMSDLQHVHYIKQTMSTSTLTKLNT